MTTTTRPPIPRWCLVWTASDWQATGSDRLAAFAYDRTTGADMAGIRATNASLAAWRECALEWAHAAGYTFAELHTARDLATGTTPDTCAAVALLEDGRAIALPEAAIQGEPPWHPHWWDGTPSNNPFGPRRHSNSGPGTPETDEPPRGAP